MTFVSRRKLSWLNYDQVYRVNWLRARARVARVNEEVLNLRYEMAWAVLWLANTKNQWRERAISASSQGQFGHLAYAYKQMDMWASLESNYCTMFKGKGIEM